MRSVWIAANGSIFSSPTAPPLDIIPRCHPSDYLTIPHTVELTDVYGLQWVLPAYPQLAFQPVFPRFQGSLLECLHCPKAFPVVQVGSQWQLRPDLIRQWDQLETALIHMSDILMGQCRFALSLNAINYRYPNDFGYKRAHKTYDAAVRCARNSRNSFVPLLASCSMGMALAVVLDGVSRAPMPAWIHYLNPHFHPDWLEKLRQSWVGDFSPNTQRVSVVIDPGCFLYASLLKTWVDLNIPLYFCWGHSDATYEGRISTFKPSDEQVRQAKLPSEASVSSGDLAPVEPLPPKPLKGTRQRCGESWPQFFAKQRERHEKLAQAQDSTERQKRLQRERTIHNGPMTRPHKRAKVFIWEKAEENDQYYIRRRLSAADAEIEFENYRPAQRMYNSFEDEWDLCEDFSPAPLPTWRDFHSQDPGDDFEMEQDPGDDFEMEQDLEQSSGNALPDAQIIPDENLPQPMDNTLRPPEAENTLRPPEAENTSRLPDAENTSRPPEAENTSRPPEAEITHQTSSRSDFLSLEDLLHRRFGFDWDTSAQSYLPPNPAKDWPTI